MVAILLFATIFIVNMKDKHDSLLAKPQINTVNLFRLIKILLMLSYLLNL